MAKTCKNVAWLGESLRGFKVVNIDYQTRIMYNGNYVE